MTSNARLIEIVTWNVIFLAFVLGARSGWELLAFGTLLCYWQYCLHKGLRV